MKSIAQMLEQISALLQTKRDLSPWEHEFVSDLYGKFIERDKRTDWISGKQAAIIERIYRKNFA